MSGECDIPEYRQLHVSNEVPGNFRRTKSVRASLRMLSSRLKPITNKNNVQIESDSEKEIFFEGFGKNQSESMDNIWHNERLQRDKRSTKLFSGFSKGNLPEFKPNLHDIPDNVAPKAAALLQISQGNTQTDNKTKMYKPFSIDRNLSNSMLNAKYSKDFKNSTVEIGISEGKNRTATIRRSPYWIINSKRFHTIHLQYTHIKY